MRRENGLSFNLNVCVQLQANELMRAKRALNSSLVNCNAGLEGDALSSTQSPPMFEWADRPNCSTDPNADAPIRERATITATP